MPNYEGLYAKNKTIDLLQYTGVPQNQIINFDDENEEETK